VNALKKFESSRGQYMIRDGKRIYIKTVNEQLTPAQQKQQQRRQRRFAQVPLDWVARTGSARAIVPVWLCFLAYQANSDTFPVSSCRIKEWGVARWALHRELGRLEARGVIKVVRQPRRAPLVTLVGWRDPRK
jgi:hypothetical protein